MLHTNRTIGQEILDSKGLNFDNKYIYLISLGALFGFTIVFNLGFILALTFLKGKYIFSCSVLFQLKDQM